MIGRPEWFTYRLMGWGIRPRTWQGWVYLGAFLALFALAAQLPAGSATRSWSLGVLTALLVLDAVFIMSRMGAHHDEREHSHQLIIERHCSFAAVAALVAAITYQVYQHRVPGVSGNLPCDPWLVGVLAVMAVTKIGSSLYVRMKL